MLVASDTRFLLLLHLGSDKTAVNVEKMMRRAIVGLGRVLGRGGRDLPPGDPWLAG